MQVSGRHHVPPELVDCAGSKATRLGSVDDALAVSQQLPGLLQLMGLGTKPAETSADDPSLGLGLPVVAILALMLLRPVCTRWRITLFEFGDCAVTWKDSTSAEIAAADHRLTSTLRISAGHERTRTMATAPATPAPHY